MLWQYSQKIMHQVMTLFPGLFGKDWGTTSVPSFYSCQRLYTPFLKQQAETGWPGEDASVCFFHANIAELMVLFLISFYFKLLFIHCSWMFMNTSVLRPMCESQRTVFKILLSPSTLNSGNQTHVSGLQDKHFYLLSQWTGLGVVFISSSWKASCVVMKTHHTQ